MSAPTRDPKREEHFLRHAASTTFTRDAFVEHCARRLEQGDREFGDRWSRTSLSSYVRELAEEAADLGAWAALADQAADLELGTGENRELRLALFHIARAGALAHQAAATLARSVDVDMPAAIGA